MTVAALGGCTGMQQKTTLAPKQQAEDLDYIAQVEQSARARGVAVRWVNPPQKKTKVLQRDPQQDPPQNP